MNTQALQDPIKRDCFQMTLKDHLLSEFPYNIEEHWTKLKTSIISACEQTIGYQTKKHQDWFDENYSEIERMIDKKRKDFQIWQKDRNCATKKKTYANAKIEVQRRTRELKKHLVDKKSSRDPALSRHS
ncbi:Hypothetical predicted protein [Podarcis lilfordi]|uniref:Uncharacterized protein n=1 Tax=Podarcis lilfordi TaxID=74358 RepID=A0AA35K6B6_9SAUR|nr:Hypothetical predicted protein [Podarcis lilfordi]